MFKCKISLPDYDKNDKSVPNVELAKAKAIAKASVKKLSGKVGEKTDFYITKDYFENKGKPVGHFLALGVSKKLAKHFVMKEIKGKGIAADTKSAATGTVCIKNIGGKDVLCFEPNPKCKIPASQWPKLLKALKAFFAGYKAVVMIEGKAIEEEPGGEEDKDTDAGEEIVFEDDNDIASDDADLENEGEEAESEEAPSPVNVATLQAEVKTIIDAVKAFSAGEMAAVKTEKSAKTIMAAWKKGQEIADKIAAWTKNAAPNATALVKESDAAKKAGDSIKAIMAQLQPTIDKINAQQGEKSTADLDTLGIDIATKIADLIKNFGTEIESIPGVKELLNAIQ